MPGKEERASARACVQDTARSRAAGERRVAVFGAGRDSRAKKRWGKIERGGCDLKRFSRAKSLSGEERGMVR